MTPQDLKQDNKGSDHKQRSLFGRRQGRALRGERARVIEEILPVITPQKQLLTERHETLPSEYFKKEFNKYILEIGFGHGERLAQHAQNETDTGFLGAEPFVNGMSAFLLNIEQQNKENIRAIMDDGMILARSIKPKTLDEIYVLNPDPWHKKRHYKRRLINQKTLDIFAHILKPNGKLIMTTDVPDLAEWMCIHANTHTAFTWNAQNRNEWETPPKNWITTKYEQKGAKGAKKMVYLLFTKTEE